MRNRGVITVLTYCILGLAGVISFLLPDSLTKNDADASTMSTARRQKLVAPAVNSHMSSQLGNDPASRTVLGPQRALPQQPPAPPKLQNKQPKQSNTKATPKSYATPR